MLVTASVLIACRPGQEPLAEAPPIVIITLGALPAHLVGALGGEEGWTPHLDELASEFWVERAVAPSSSPIPSMASLMTGVDGWAHQLVSHRAKRLRADVATLPEALGDGWSSHAFFPLRHRYQDFGLLSAFDDVEELPPADEMGRVLERVEGRSLVWIHLPDPVFPWVDRREQVPRLGPRKGTYERVERRWLMPYADPKVDVPEPLLAESQELLRHQVAWADEQIGRWIAALRRDPEWPGMWVVVTALHGVEMGEHGQILFAQNLERLAIEVPLFVKPSSSSELRLGDLPFASTSRIAATLLEGAGLRPSPAMAPSLFDAAEGALSSLYDHGGVNRLSLVRSAGTGGAVQVLWGRRYAREEPEMWAAEAVEAGLGSQPVEESPRLVLGRIRRAFRDVPPLQGLKGVPPEVRLVRWRQRSAADALEDAATKGRMLQALLHRWRQFHSVERPPRGESRYWSEEGR